MYGRNESDVRLLLPKSDHLCPGGLSTCLQFMGLLHDIEDFLLDQRLERGAPTLTTTKTVIYTILASDNNADYITSAQVEKSRPIRVDRWTSLSSQGN